LPIPSRARSFLVFTAVAALVTLPVLRLWNPAFTLDGRDVHRLFRPAAYALQARFEQRQFPEWEPAIACGQPLVGLGQSQLFYPPKWLLFLAGPERTLALLAVWHPLFAAACAFLLARRLGLGAASAGCATLVSAGTPLWLSSFVSPNLEYAAAWAPLVLYLGLRYGEEGRLRDAALAGLAVAMQVLAGSFELAFGTGLACAAVALGAAEQWRRVLTGIGVVAAVALLVGAPDWLPVAAHAREGPRREGLPLDEAARWSLSARDLPSLVLPAPPPSDETLREYMERQALFDSVFVGAVAFVLAVVGAVHGRRRLWLPGAVVLLLLSLGKWGGLFPVFHLVPGLDRLRYPVKFLLLLAPLLAIGVGQGAEALWRLSRRWAVAPLLAMGLVLLWANRSAGAGTVFGLAVLAGAMWLRLRIAALFALVALMAELFVSSLSANGVPVTPVAVLQRLRGEVPSVDPRLRLGVRMSDRDWWSLGHEESAPPEVDAFALNFPQAAGVRLANGYGPNISLRVTDLYKHGGPGARALMAERLVFERTPAVAAGEAGVSVSRAYGPVALVSYERGIPRGILVPRWRVLSPEEVRKAVLAPGFSATDEVLLETDPGLPPPEWAGDPKRPLPSPGFSEPRPEEVTLRFETREPVIALLQDTWDPGWSATVDGAPARVLRANHAFLGVPVGPGAHVVTFRFKSVPMRVGFGMAFAGLALVALSFRRQKR